MTKGTILKKRSLMASLLLACGACCGLLFVFSSPDRTAVWSDPLASESVLFSSPDPAAVYVSAPGITVCPDGRLIAVFSVKGEASVYNTLPGVIPGGRCFVYTSDDGGGTWMHRANLDLSSARVFFSGEAAYMMGSSGDLRISRSADRGETWSDPVDLTSGEMWSGSANNVLVKGSRVYLTLDRRMYNASSAWSAAELSPQLLRGEGDLMNPANWTVSPAGAFIDRINDRSMNTLAGLPFYPSFYPDAYYFPDAGGRSAGPSGWLEGNVVQITDPHHQFYDPSGTTFHLFLRAATGLANIGAMLKVTEHPDGSMTTSFQQSPSGRDMVYIPLPGGQQSFHVLYDEQTALYWLLSSQASDSMIRAEFLGEDRPGAPFDQQRKLHLYFSKNMYDWCAAGPVAAGGSEKESRSCAAMTVQGDDLVLVSRSGNQAALSADRCNRITFHRIRNFRGLVY